MFVTLRTDELSPERGSRSTRENCARVIRHDGCKSTNTFHVPLTHSSFFVH